MGRAGRYVRGIRTRALPCLLASLAVAGLLAGCAAAGSPARRAPTITAGSAPTGTAASAPTSTTAGAPRGTSLLPTTETSLALVDTTRPTLDKGRLVSQVRHLTTIVWYPAVPGPWPLVVFASGFGVGPGTYTALLESWAQAGFVVAAPEFPLTDPAVAGANLDESDIANQPADVRFVTDALVAPGSPVATEIDRARVGVAGQSDGAETVLAASLAPVPAGEPSYRAVIAMSGQPLGPRSSTKLPILVLQGSADTIDAPSHGYEVYSNAAPPKYLEVLHGGGHLAPFVAGSAWLPSISAVTTEFLDLYVAGHGSPAAIRAAGNHPPLASIQSS